MESGSVAAVAVEAGLPFLAVRAVADRAQDTLPGLVEKAVKPDGMPAVTRKIGALLLHPWQLSATLRLARQSDRSEEHTSELQSLMRNSYAVFCLKKKKTNIDSTTKVTP